jgi:uncharacterized protein (TIGR02145 family)
MIKQILTIFAIILLLSAWAYADICGDVNKSGSLNLLDVSYNINFLYRHGPSPVCGIAFASLCGDVNGDNKLNLLDISYIINFLYRSGPTPICEPATGTVTDIDGNIYQTQKIGDQWWMVENLKVTHYRNGDYIPEVTGTAAWAALFTGAYCKFNNDINNIALYGLMYNWYAVNESRNIAPEGWHVAGDEEWKELELYLGMNSSEVDNYFAWRGTDQGGKLKEAGISHWVSPNSGATNIWNFSALPGGARNDDGTFENITLYAHYWCGTEYDLADAWGRSFGYDQSGIGRYYYSKRGGASIRCVKD